MQSAHCVARNQLSNKPRRPFSLTTQIDPRYQRNHTTRNQVQLSNEDKLAKRVQFTWKILKWSLILAIFAGFIMKVYATEEDTENIWKTVRQNKKYKNNLLHVERPFISEKPFTWHPMYPIYMSLHYPNYDFTGVYIHTNNVWEDRALGWPINSTVLTYPMLGRKSEDHTNTYLYHTRHVTALTLRYITLLYLLHSLKTRVFINPVLNNLDTYYF